MIGPMRNHHAYTPRLEVLEPRCVPAAYALDAAQVAAVETAIGHSTTPYPPVPMPAAYSVGSAGELITNDQGVWWTLLSNIGGGSAQSIPHDVEADVLLLAEYPVPDAGWRVVSEQDQFNNVPAIPGSGLWRPTPLSPVPNFNLINVTQTFGPWMAAGWTPNPNPGLPGYILVPTDAWVNAQNTIYAMDTDPASVGQWSGWLAAWQQQVRQWDGVLDAGQASAPQPVPDVAPPVMAFTSSDLQAKAEAFAAVAGTPIFVGPFLSSPDVAPNSQAVPAGATAESLYADAALAMHEWYAAHGSEWNAYWSNVGRTDLISPVW